MSFSTAWIKSNMLGTPGNSPKRVMSEVEMRVQRALQKLEIPEWYLNKHSKAPKILKNHTPIDYRQPSWKQGYTKQTINQNRPSEKSTDPTRIYGNNKGLTASTNKSPLSGIYTIVPQMEDSINKSVLTVDNEGPGKDLVTIENVKPIDISEYNKESTLHNEECEKLQNTNLQNKSSTFPKVSPSRKVQNINIVLDPPSNPPSVSLEKTWETDINSNVNSEIDRMTKTFESSIGFNNSECDKFKTSNDDKTSQSSYFNSSLISPKPYSKKIGTPFFTPVHDFKIPSASTPDTMPKPFCTSTLKRPSHYRQMQFGNLKPKDLNVSLASTCNTSETLNLSTKARNGSTLQKNRKDWLNSTYWIGEVKPVGMDCDKPCAECGSKLPRFFAVVAKTKQLANNLEKQKMVNVKPQEKRVEKVVSETDSESESGSGSDVESNSAASSTSICMSFKGSEIGAAEVPATSTLKSNIGNPFKKMSTSSNKNNNNNKVHWIPVQPEYIAKTSSLLTLSKEPISVFNQKQSSRINPKSHQAPESPVQKNVDTFEAQQMEAMKKFLQLEECKILDSGYSDRSHKNESLMSSRTWFEDSISEDDESEYSFSLRGRRIMRRKY